jgi:ubiquinone/menaquinone biosynthesis C-methylase UbiE
MSPAMLKVAQEKLGADAHLQLGDASNMPYEDGFFDLITTTLTLHEMPPTMRDAVIAEMKRTLKPDGRLLWIDFRPGSLRFPKGWRYKIIITISEILAGRDHYKNYRHFMAHKGLPALIDAHDLAIDQQKIVSGGAMMLCLLSVKA